jgi:putative DNA methylase
VTAPPKQPKRLIEVDLPIRRISEHARREKSIRHGHISTLHLWWARRPLAACRAVILASLLPDPADPACSKVFREKAAACMQSLRDQRGGTTRDWNVPLELRASLLDFIADFADWDNANNQDLIRASRLLIQAAHDSFRGEDAGRPLVVDPFAGGGAIPLEALRVGADAFGSDLNPIAVLLNKVALEYVPQYGVSLADDLKTCADWVKNAAAQELADVYPLDPDRSIPIAYLWARTVRCEGPGCGATVPLLNSLWLAKRKSRSIALRLTPNKREKRIDIQVDFGVTAKDVDQGTIRNGSAICPVCDFTTANASVRAQLSKRHGGASDARLLAVVVTRPGEAGRSYRLPTDRDLKAVKAAGRRVLDLRVTGTTSAIPDEPIPVERPSPNARGLSAVTRMGVETFGDLFSARQALVLCTLIRLSHDSAREIKDPGRAAAIRTCLTLAVDRVAERCCSLARWDSSSKMETVAGTFGRQALPIVWDFAEQVPLRDVAGSWSGAIEWISLVCKWLANAQLAPGTGTAMHASATQHPLADDSADAVITDPPYYDSVPYADLSDFFYVWMRRSLGDVHPELFQTSLSPKDEEAIWNPSRIYQKTGLPKDERFYESQMVRALTEARRVVTPAGIAVVVFAHKSTSGWEAILSALIEAGWIATASWPIDTEMGKSRQRRGDGLACLVGAYRVPPPRNSGQSQDERRGRMALGAVGATEEDPRLDASPCRRRSCGRGRYLRMPRARARDLLSLRASREGFR